MSTPPPSDPSTAKPTGPSDAPAAGHHHQLRDTPGRLIHRPRPRLLQKLDELSPYWGPQVVVLVIILMDLILPRELTLGPSWLLPAIAGTILVVLATVSPHPTMRNHPRRRQIAIGLIGLVSAINIFSLVRLCHALINGGHGINNGRILIASGAALWITNVLLFALWYWEMDRGGPAGREGGVQRYPDFQFVQMGDARPYTPEGWKPGLVDYLYLSFTNATAFSPTDTMPLTATAKSLMSAQALTSLVTVGLVVARAVNILNS